LSASVSLSVVVMEVVDMSDCTGDG
jgi:hypothetical protein